MKNLIVTHQAIINACEKLHIPYILTHKDNILLTVNLDKPLYFVQAHTPFDREDIYRICKDKDLSYTMLKGICNVPKWMSFLDPEVTKEYENFIHEKSIQEIINTVADWSRPLIVKRNQGSKGVNVFLCETTAQITQAFNSIFDQNSKHYDYVGLAQEYIQPEAEYRVIAYKGKALLAYKKDISNAHFTSNLSPLHWEGSKAVHITDPNLLKQFESYIAPIFKKLPIVYIGFDIIKRVNGPFYLIEMNKSPGVDIFVRDNGLDPVTQMYIQIIEDLRRNPIK